MSDALRLYAPDELAADGYPPEWHRLPDDVLFDWEPLTLLSPGMGIKHVVRAEARHRCVRCLHPYRSDTAGPGGEWSPCDEECVHGGALLAPLGPFETDRQAGDIVRLGVPLSARWRILTVHHLDGNKANCRWWNLAALCQRCHLQIQGKVQMARVWPWEHTEWFRPYVAGYYAHAYLDEDLTRAETLGRLDELLALERVG